ncbi:MAG TPA: aspartate aminotransferase family protein [Armatimonadota bacterium]|jgi:4-aminobutyrate aminotransferase|nr:aspartate aminotransferase family protein [Armatimonadota bacterium]HOJ20717.1 aspartate aminotransferase family protein [Armatimonadota bacterium]HOM80867.1 aspartate aminotransferase family protein [Armatimonadota bacterium]HPO72260.1 aspartate aminotransferase family protein [Armatimonadota bacterium]
MSDAKKVACVKGPLPGPRSRELFERWRKAEAQCAGYQAQVVWDHARGVVVTDVDGNTFLDWTSGVLVTNVGHCHPALVQAIQQASEKLLNNYECLNEPRVIAAEKLTSVLPRPLDRCFFLSTGSETVEAAVRIMKRKTGNYEVISFYGGFHGRTYAAAAAGGMPGPKKGYGPTLPGAIRAPYPYCYRCPFKAKPETCGMLCLEFLDDCVRANSTGSLAGLIVEPYQGASGFIFPPEGWLSRLEQWVRSKGLVFTVDEVQASYGRTGKFWAVEWEGVQPDLLCIGKGIGSGLPVSAIAARSEVIGVLGPGEMSSTMGGNPVASACVTAVIDIMLRENLAENARRMGELLGKRLREIQERSPYVGDVRGKGLVFGVELVKDKATKEPAPDLTRKLIDVAAQNGLLIGSVGVFGNVIRVAPPLVINEAELDESLEIFERSLGQL